MTIAKRGMTLLAGLLISANSYGQNLVPASWKFHTGDSLEFVVRLCFLERMPQLLLPVQAVTYPKEDTCALRDCLKRSVPGQAS